MISVKTNFDGVAAFYCQVPLLLRTPDFVYLENILPKMALIKPNANSARKITIGTANHIPNVLNTQKSLIVKSKGTGHSFTLITLAGA